MNQQLKQRLIGAVVLVSLAVIFVPMLLEGHRGGDAKDAHGDIPPRPDYGFKTIEIPLEVPKVDSASTTMVEQPAGAPKLIERAAKPKPVIASVEQPAKPAASTPTATPKPPTQPAPQQASATEPVEAWAVQVGSFGTEGNALGLRNKLRKDGFNAYVEKVAAGSGTVFRVRVGPELRREKADNLREQLERKDGLKGIVVRHHDS